MDRSSDISSSTISFFVASAENQSIMKCKKRFFFGKNAIMKFNKSNIVEPKDFVRKIKIDRKDEKNGEYSMVSSSDLTPGSLEVWVDLPDEIRFDPSLAPFKHLYEQQHGKLDPEAGENTVFVKKITENSVEDKGDQKRDNKDEGDRFTKSTQEDGDKKINKKRNRQVMRIARVIKLSVLVSCWILLTLSLVLNMEKSETVLHTAVTAGEIKEYELPENSGRVEVLLKLSGPFAPTSNNSGNVLYLWLHRLLESEGSVIEQNSTIWTIRLQPDDILDFSKSVMDTNTLVLENRQSVPEIPGKNNYTVVNSTDRLYEDIGGLDVPESNETKVTLRISSTTNSTVPLTLSYQLNPLGESEGIAYATVLLLSLYVLIIFEIVNRTIAALLSSTLGVAVLAMQGARPSLPELISWLDAETLLLLFSMMLLVAILAETGLFDYLAVIAFQVTGGRTWPLINCLCLFTAVFSTFLDNVTTVLLMTPVTIRLCEVMQLNPVPVLMSMVIFSNVGGAATPVGDPPNVIIASHPVILRENINFASFTLHMGVGILAVSVQTYLQLRFIFRDMNKLRHSVPIDIQELRQEIAVWRRAAASLSSYSRDEDLVRKALEKKVERLNTALAKREAGKGTSRSDPRFCSTLAQMKEKYHIRDKQLLIKAIISLTFVVAVFFLHAIPELQSLSLGWTALLGALLLLLLAEKEDLEPILARVEWSTLLFFAALFVLMEVLSKLGLIAWIGKITETLILSVGEESRLAVAILLVLWVSGIASAFVDNIPLTTMMIRVTVALADPAGLGLPLAPLAWALSFGACLGGNGTLIGASANVVCAGVAEQHGYRFTFIQFLKIGFPVMIGNLAVSSVYLMICHCVFTWH